MPVTLTDAKAAVISLHGSVDAVIKNATLHDNSHWSKEKAFAALQNKALCGYYWKKSTRDKWTRPTDGDVMYTKPTPKKIRKYTKTTETNYLPIDVNGCWIILGHALKSAKNDDDVLFVQGQTDTSFVCGSSFPSGYGGETLRRGGGSEACTRVAIVIQTGLNTQIVTHFPAADSYFTGKTGLV